MANRKDDEKNERIIRNLLKLADNRRCINCNSLGPQYVCTNFWTFVCTACSGIHREFTHRVKSVSMAKFSSQEVSALQTGGNAHAKQIYFKEWDPQRQSAPDSRNVEKLRDFIKHVYVDRRYTGEKSYDKHPRAKTGEADEPSDNKSGSRSPLYSDRPSPGGKSDDRDFRNSYDERRSPGFDRISPARTEIVNDWRREDRFGNLRKSDDGRISDGSTKLERRSPDSQQDSDMSSPPMVRPVREILGDNVSPLRIIEPPRVIEPPKVNGGRGTDGSVRAQRTASSSSLASSSGNPTEIKNNTLGSLIDFDAAPDPPATTVVPQTQPTGSNQPIVQPTAASTADNWACFDSPPEKKATQSPPTMNTIDSLLSGLSVSAPVSNVTMFPPVSAPTESPFGFGAFGVGQTNISAANGGQMPTMPPQQYSGFPASQPFVQQVGGPSNHQPWSSSTATVGQNALNMPAGQPHQAVARPDVEVSFAGVQKSSSPEVKPTGRHALPEDLFASTYSYSVRTPAWQAGPPHGFAYNAQYNVPMHVQNFQQFSKSTNPFDVSNDFPPVQASRAWMPPQSSYPSQSFASAMPPNAYMGQQIPNNLFPGQGLGGDGAAVRSMNPNQQLGGIFFPPATQNTYSTLGGNPFG